MASGIIDDSLLTRLLLFQGVNPSSIRQWIDRCKLIDFLADDILLSPDKENDIMYVLLSGAVSIHLQDPKSLPIAHVYEGECVGELSVFDGKHPSAWVKATVTTSTLAIPREILLTLIDHSHGVARNLLYLLSTRLRTGNALINDSHQLQKEYEQHANVDVLTGLYNRRWVNNYFKRLFNRIEHDKQIPELSVILIDVDFFKHFNDTQGHNAGDCALRTLAHAMESSLRPTDRIARYGGEEFLIILPDTTPRNATTVAERVRKSVENAVIAQNDMSYPTLTISLGIAPLKAGDQASDLLHAADTALYAAKQEGRNKYCVADR